MKYVSTNAVASNVMSKVNHSLLTHYLKAIKLMELCAHFNIGRFNVKQFLKWIKSSNAVPATIVADVIRTKVSAYLQM